MNHRRILAAMSFSSLFSFFLFLFLLHAGLEVGSRRSFFGMQKYREPLACGSPGRARGLNGEIRRSDNPRQGGRDRWR